MANVYSLACKDFVTTQCVLDLNKIGPGSRKRVMRALECGFIDCARGTASEVFEAFSTHFELPTIRVPKIGYRGACIEVYWGLAHKRPETLINILEHELWPAEVIAAKMIHGGRKDDSYLRNSKGRLTAGAQSAQQPHKAIRDINAIWTFKNTRPDWGEIVGRARDLDPDWSARHSKALATLGAGGTTLVYVKPPTT